MSNEGRVRAESLSKFYRSGGEQITVFRDLSFELRPGEKVAVIGESGAGKSTLLHLLGALDRPSSGRIFYGDRDIAGLGEQALAQFRNRQIGFVWQNPSLLAEFTALENVTMPLLIRGVAPDVAAHTAMVRLDEVGLSRRRLHRAGELSGGEQQRVALARALAAGPKVLLADEPTGNLDLRSGEAIMSLLSELLETHGLTSLFVTHNLSFAQRCDRVLELKKGSLQSASPADWAGIGVVQDATRLGGGTYV